MAFQTPITIKEAVQLIDERKYLLPAIQREVVWNVDQITRLFDSLMRGYPIGSFLFWHVKRQETTKFQFYEFVRDYHEKDCRHNPKANINGMEDITAILDGQQRLTALYIGLKGSYAYREPRKRWDNPQAYPKRQLYLNLLDPHQNPDETDLIYNFAFLTPQEARLRDEKTFWFEVGRILNLKESSDVSRFLRNSDLRLCASEQAEFAEKTLFRLWEMVHKENVINYYLEKDESLDKVLNIFIRVNSGGTVLSYSDLLLSIATAQWQEGDAREEITALVDELNDIGEGFRFDKDLVLKSSLVLAGFKDIAFKVDNFNRANMKIIEGQWDDIERALRHAVQLVASFGYNRERLTANYAIIPIAYYLRKKGLPKNFEVAKAKNFPDDREAIRRWLICALVKRVFGGAPDTVLRPMREILDEGSDAFPLSRIIERFRGTPHKSLVFTEDEIENLLCYKYGQGYTFSILALLYPSLDFRNRFHIDHIHPRSQFTKPKMRQRGIPEEEIDFYLENVDRLPNLQLLEGVPNQEKSDSAFAEWFHANHTTPEAQRTYRERHYIPETDLSFTNFKQFFEQRKALMKDKLRQILLVS